MHMYHKLQLRTTEVGAYRGRYQRLVGKLIYLAHTRPDIGFAVSMVSRFMSNPSGDHMEAVMKILRYLKSSPGTGLFFRKNTSCNLEVYTDADWAGSITDRQHLACVHTYGGT